jgi:hypothetical protein
MGNEPRRIHKPKANLIFSGLIGVGIVSIVELLSVNPLSKSLRVAVFCFSISIPFLAGAIFVLSELATLNDELQIQINHYFRFLYFYGVLFSLAGIAAIFFHFHYAFGIVFIVASVVALVCALMFFKKLAQSLEDVDAEQIFGRERRERVSHDDWPGAA